VEFQPKSISCIGCKDSFIFSIEEQVFFHSLGLTNVPKRCLHCRLLMRLRREGKSTDTLTQLNCCNCGEKASVPFLPKNEKKIFCVTCYREFKKGNLRTLAEA
jgi:CxxC-x17-CxxC domain-containing protein